MALEDRLRENLRKLRKKQDMTQERLAEKAGLEYKYIQMLEGKKPPSATLRTLEKLARALGVNPVELLKPVRAISRRSRSSFRAP